MQDWGKKFCDFIGCCCDKICCKTLLVLVVDFKEEALIITKLKIKYLDKKKYNNL